MKFRFGRRTTGRLRLAAGIAAALTVALIPSVAWASAARLPASGVQRGGVARLVPGSLRVGPALTRVNSLNWSGYADLSAKGSTYTTVAGDWTQPAVKCTSATATAVFWVGLDGVTSPTVEQNGTLAECIGGTAHYYDWWEMYPVNTVQYVHKVSPGDKMSASVVYTGKAYKLTVTDHTHTADSFTTTQKCGSTACQNNSAQWIAERPSGSSGLYQLADYGTCRFTAASVTSGKTTGPISTFPDIAITMVNSDRKTLASLSTLAAKGTSFTDTWHRSQ